MPSKMDGYLQSVIVQGKLCVGGGNGKSNHSVMIYDTSLKVWSQLKPHEGHAFAMAVVNEQLVLVGGEKTEVVLPLAEQKNGESLKTKNGNSDEKSTEDMIKSEDDVSENKLKILAIKMKTLAVWHQRDEEWIHPYPEMVESRSHCSAIGYRDRIFVAGGWSSDNSGLLSSMEILDVQSKQWFSGPSTPVPWHSMKVTIIEGMAYFMGGSTRTGAAKNPYSFTFEDSSWKTLAQPPNSKSIPLAVGKELLAVGGRAKDESIVSAIYSYREGIKQQWLKIGDLRSPRCYCTCAYHETQVLVVGGCDHEEKRLGSLDIGLVLAPDE